MKAILDTLSQGLDPEIRARLRECVETMQRHLKFLADSDNANLTQLSSPLKKPLPAMR